MGEWCWTRNQKTAMSMFGVTLMKLGLAEQQDLWDIKTKNDGPITIPTGWSFISAGQTSATLDPSKVKLP